MKAEVKFENLVELLSYFSEQNKCKEFIETMRWSDERICPHCGHNKTYDLKAKFSYKCAQCKKPFSVTKGTIFENSPIPLQKWFAAIYLITSHKKGISSLQLHRDLGITQKSAWFVLQRIRYAIRMRSFNKPLENVVEADETFIGGKNKNRHADKKVEFSQGRSVKDKMPVFGLLERKGKIAAMPVKDTSGKTLQPLIKENVVPGSQIMTDEWLAYRGLSDMYVHSVINHGEKQSVIGDCHTNTLEGFWSLLKRGIIGIYHQISLKHLDKYVDEFQYRYNTKGLTERDRFLNMLSMSESRLTYKNLIQKS